VACDEVAVSFLCDVAIYMICSD